MNVQSVGRRVWLCAVLLFPLTCGAASFDARVIGITDGDTLTVLVQRERIKGRLADIDAPEKKQPYGQRSRQSLAQLCFGKNAGVDEHGHDRYGRIIARVICAGTDANAEQVRRGMAWVFERYARRDSPLYAVEAEARVEGRGLWADAGAVAPWEWRRQREKAKQSLESGERAYPGHLGYRHINQ